MSISSIIAECFDDTNGIAPFENSLGGSRRDGQVKFAKNYADFLDRVPPVSKDQDGITRPLLQIAEVATGVGKTNAYVAVAAIAAAAKNNRTLISTFTKNLRKEIVDQQNFVDSLLSQLGLSKKVTIGEYISISGACSVNKLAELRKKYEDSEEYCAWVERQYHNGDIPTPSDFVASGGNFDWFPVTDTTMPSAQNPTWDLDYLTIRNDKDIYKEFGKETVEPYIGVLKNQKIRNVENIENSDILVITHAMLVQDLMKFGSLLETKNPFKHVIIDEADCYAEQGNNIFDAELSVEELYYIKNNIDKEHQNVLDKKIKLLCEVLEHHLGDKEEVSLTGKECEESYDYIAEKILFPIKEIITEAYQSCDDFMIKSKIDEIFRKIDFFMSHYEDVGDSKYSAQDSAAVTVKAKLRDDRYVIYQSAVRSQALTSRLWRHYNTHKSTHISLISGTLMDPYKKDTEAKCEDFRYLSGIYDIDNYEVCDPIGLDDRGISNIVFHNMEHEPIKDSKLNEEYWNDVFSALSKTKDSKTLVLLTSYVSLRYLEKLHKNNPLFEGRVKVLFQQSSGAASAINELKEFVEEYPDKSFMVFGLNWFGVNYTNNGKTMINRIIFPQKPLPAAKHNSPLPAAKHKNHRTSYITRAVWRMRQGIGRGLRNCGDSVTIEMMDPRLVKYSGSDCNREFTNSVLHNLERDVKYFKKTEDGGEEHIKISSS